MSIKIAIVEDDKHYSNALKKIINSDENLLCVAQLFDGKEAREKLIFYQPDVVLMDIRLPDILGYQIVAVLSTEMENTAFIMCTNYEDDESLFKSLKAGASGYLVKGDSMEKIISSIKEAYSGGAPMSFAVAKRVLQHFRQEHKNIELENLTPTEKEVLELLAQGFLYKEIADKKFVTIDTIKKHVGNIYRKLHVNNKVEAINMFNQNKN